MALRDNDRNSWFDAPDIEDLIVYVGNEEYWKSCIVLRINKGQLYIDERYGPDITKSVEIFKNKKELEEFIDTLISIKDKLKEE